ncbi:MAG: S8 family serine peptidase, partial [Bdellovibrionales bacterium]|nr:S8 family serine peptidase [Bdellovibrionales bacterium]
MKILSISLLFLSLNLFASNPHSSEYLIVKMKKGEMLPSLSSITKVDHYFGDLYKLRVSNIKDVEDTLTKLDIVEYIEKDYLGAKNKLAQKDILIETNDKSGKESFNDPDLSRQWHLRSSSDKGISAIDAYRNRRRESREKIIVAVVDTGIDYNHEDLRDVVWTNEGEIPNNGIDDDGNGYIDDIHGINTLKRTKQGVATGEVMDTHGHGTHVSGIIGATQNNGIGIAGIASNVAIMGIRTVPNSGDEKDTDVIESFLYAAKNGAKIINCSFGKSHNEGGMAVSETIDHIYKEYGTI